MSKDQTPRQQRETCGVYYRPPDEGELTDEAFFSQLQEASRFAGSRPAGGLQPPQDLLET